MYIYINSLHFQKNSIAKQLKLTLKKELIIILLLQNKQKIIPSKSISLIQNFDWDEYLLNHPLLLQQIIKYVSSSFFFLQILNKDNSDVTKKIEIRNYNHAKVLGEAIFYQLLINDSEYNNKESSTYKYVKNIQNRLISNCGNGTNVLLKEHILHILMTELKIKKKLINKNDHSELKLNKMQQLNRFFVQNDLKSRSGPLHNSMLYQNSLDEIITQKITQPITTNQPINNLNNNKNNNGNKLPSIFNRTNSLKNVSLNKVRKPIVRLKLESFYKIFEQHHNDSFIDEAIELFDPTHRSFVTQRSVRDTCISIFLERKNLAATINDIRANVISKLGIYLYNIFFVFFYNVFLKK